MLLVFFFTGVLVLGCGNYQIHLILESSKFLNLDDSGAPLPVVVRIYQLSSKNRFESADFTTLWKNDREVLENDTLDRQEITLNPDSSVVLNLDSKKNPAYLAVMALFRKPQGDTWRQVIPLQASKVRSVRITVHERSTKTVTVE
ncbi:MAG: type VI secretion system lipoprotein TssJ [Nitrospirae bacterium]|nr:type VI secretion system lipoprotein TssJ [Nitrospirota bacterium]